MTEAQSFLLAMMVANTGSLIFLGWFLRATRKIRGRRVELWNKK